MADTKRIPSCDVCEGYPPTRQLRDVVYHWEDESEMLKGCFCESCLANKPDMFIIESTGPFSGTIGDWLTWEETDNA